MTFDQVNAKQSQRFIAEAMRRPLRVRGMSDLTSEQNRRLREAMIAARKEVFGDNVSRLADAIGRAQPSISDFLNGKGGASLETARRFAKKVLKKGVLEVIGESDEPDAAQAVGRDAGLPAVLQAAIDFARVNGIPDDVVADYRRTQRADGFVGARADDLYAEMKTIASMRRRGIVEPDATDEMEHEIEAAKRTASRKPSKSKPATKK